MRGYVLVSLTLTLPVLLAVVGLAIDGSISYNIKAKLQTSVDAAALNAARSLARGISLPSQEAAARASAQKVFDANFPNGWWSTQNKTFSVNIAETAFKTRTVTTQACVDSPLTFLRILRLEEAHLCAGAVASRRDVNLILVLDRSGSVAAAGADDEVRDAARRFARKFAEGRDRLGLVSFSGRFKVDFDHSMNFLSGASNIITAIDNLVFDGNTGTAQGLWRAYMELQEINEPGALNVIVFFTDGRPTALAGRFPVKTLQDTRYGTGVSAGSQTDDLYLTPPSPCSSSAAKEGFIAAPINQFDPIGVTWGVMRNEDSSEWRPATDSSSCSYYSGTYTSNARRPMRLDISVIPAQDLYGNATTGYKAFVAGQDIFSAGPYAGGIRPDSPRAVRYAAYNAADNGAQRIRNDATLNPLVFTIGLGGTGAETIDHEFLRRMANDTLSPIYDSTRPAGLYVYSPTDAELDAAFNTVASEILRLQM
jgi:Flp pilus assembly protein TadG